MVSVWASYTIKCCAGLFGFSTPGRLWGWRQVVGWVQQVASKVLWARTNRPLQPVSLEPDSEISSWDGPGPGIGLPHIFSRKWTKQEIESMETRWQREEEQEASRATQVKRREDQAECSQLGKPWLSISALPFFLLLPFFQVFIKLLLLIISNSKFPGHSIKCWVCRSDGDPKCADPFDNRQPPLILQS